MVLIFSFKLIEDINSLKAATVTQKISTLEII